MIETVKLQYIYIYIYIYIIEKRTEWGTIQKNGVLFLRSRCNCIVGHIISLLDLNKNSLTISFVVS